MAWSQEQLAAAAGVSIPTIKRLEAQEGPLGGRDETGSKIRLALEAAGVELTNGDQPGVRLAKAAAGPAETAGASKPTVAAKTVSSRTAKASKRRR